MVGVYAQLGRQCLGVPARAGHTNLIYNAQRVAVCFEIADDAESLLELVFISVLSG